MGYQLSLDIRSPGDETWCRCHVRWSCGDLIEHQGEKFWQCATCDLPSAHVPEGDSVVRGPRDARALLSASAMQSGVREIMWAIRDQDGQPSTVTTIEYQTYPRTIPMSHPEPLLFSMWELLQSKVRVILAEPNGPSDNEIEAGDRERARYEARGIAEALAIILKPFMADPDAVVKAAVKAHKDPTYEPPGLGLHLWNPFLNPDGTARTPTAAPRTKPAAGKPVAKPKRAVDNKSARKLADDEIEAVKTALDSGMFTKEDVASMFKVSLATIDAAVA